MFLWGPKLFKVILKLTVYWGWNTWASMGSVKIFLTLHPEKTLNRGTSYWGFTVSSNASHGWTLCTLGWWSGENIFLFIFFLLVCFKVSFCCTSATIFCNDDTLGTWKLEKLQNERVFHGFFFPNFSNDFSAMLPLFCTAASWPVQIEFFTCNVMEFKIKMQTFTCTSLLPSIQIHLFNQWGHICLLSAQCHAITWSAAESTLNCKSLVKK